MSKDQDDLSELFEEVYQKNHGDSLEKKSEFKSESSESPGSPESLDDLFEKIYTEKHGAEASKTAAQNFENTSSRHVKDLPNDEYEAVRRSRNTFASTAASRQDNQEIDRIVSRMVSEIPGMQERLSYITKIADEAASLVIELAEAAMPKVDGILADCRELDSAWNQVFLGSISVAEFRNIATQTSRYFKASQDVSQQVKSLLVKVIMAQGFQDLTGQVVNKIRNTLSEVHDGFEGAGVKGLEYLPKETLEGPKVIERSDSVSNQSEVDNLLNSLGF